jgi:hypothetical protein
MLSATLAPLRTQFPHEMKDQIAYGGGHERREKYANSNGVTLKTPKESREKKKVTSSP